MSRVTPPFRADLSGACCASRPAAARDDFAVGKIGAAELKAAEDAAIRDAVTLQETSARGPRPTVSFPLRAVAQRLHLRPGRHSKASCSHGDPGVQEDKVIGWRPNAT